MFQACLLKKKLQTYTLGGGEGASFESRLGHRLFWQDSRVFCQSVNSSDEVLPQVGQSCFFTVRLPFTS